MNKNIDNLMGKFMKTQKIIFNLVIVLCLISCVSTKAPQVKNSSSNSVRPVYDVNAQDQYGNTALMNAAFSGDIQATKTLIAANANVNMLSNENETALIKAAFMGYPEIVKLLIEAGANVNVINNIGYTALTAAADRAHRTRLEHKKVVYLLLKAGADVNIRTPKGDTALMIACGGKWGLQNFEQYKIVYNLFIEAGTDLNAKNNEGMTALSIAGKFNKKEVVNILIQSGAKEN